MAAGTAGATSTYSGGKGLSFSKDISSRIVDAAEAAKNEKKHQEKIIADGGNVPEKDKKGLFVKALKQEFISNPINDLKKRFNKKIDKVGRVAGLFGSKGEKLQQKLSGKKLNTKSGFDRSGYEYNKKSDDENTSGGSGGNGSGSGLVSSLGELVLDVQQIAAAVTSMQGMIATQMNMSVKMSDSLEQIKSALIEQVSLQQEQVENQEMAAREASIEASSSSSSTAKATSTFTNDLDIFGIFGAIQQLKNVIEFIKNLPKLFSNFFKGILEKIPGGKGIAQKLFGGAAKEVGEEAVEAGGKGLLRGLLKPLRLVTRSIPFGLGGLLDFGLNLMLGEPVGKAAAKAVGSTIGSSLGAAAAGILGLPSGPGAIATAAIGAVVGGAIGDWLGGAGYDLITGIFGNKDTKMAAGGGVMIGEAGPEVVTGLQSAPAKKSLSGLQTSGGMEDVQDTYYSALAGSTLAITKDFIEGLGPVGASVAPVIQDDVAKLGRQFDIPATSTKVDVGGMGLRQDPQAAKKGENYLKELVKGTLEKLSGGKKEDKKDKSSGGDSGSGGDVEDSSTDASSGSGGTGGAGSDSASSGEKTLESLKTNTKFVNKEQTNWMGQREVVSAVSGTDKSGVRRVKMVDDSGKLSDKYYYNANGDVFSIDPTLGAKGISQLTLDQIRSYSASGSKFYRNLQTGQVVLTRVPPVGFYNYEKNGIVRSKRVDGLAGSHTEGAQVTVTTPLSSMTPVEKENFGVLPYGPVADINKIKAEGGIVVTSRKGTRTMNGKQEIHEGTDIGAPSGTKLYAFTDGKVLYKGVDGGYGNYIGWQEKGSGIGHFYGHLSAYGKNVGVGTEFSKGKILGTVGSTGRSTAPHLHWEMADNPDDLGKPKGQGKRKDPLSKYGFMSPFSGTPKPGDGVDAGTNDKDNVDGSDMSPPETPEDMFKGIAEALTGMTTGLAMMRAGELGLVKNEEDYKNYEAQFNEAFKVKDVESTGATTTPTAATPAAASRPAGGAMNGGRGSGASPTVQVQGTATASESRGRSATPSSSSTAHAYTPMAPA